MQKLGSILGRPTVAAACVAVLLSGTAQADEIYKWVDKEGKSHYSSRREDAEGASTTTIKPAPAPPMGAASAAASAAANAEIIRKGAQPPNSADRPSPARVVAVQKPDVPNYRSEAPADKCRLARDILSGAAKHTSGMPVTPRDREIAKEDVRVYCGK